MLTNHDNPAPQPAATPRADFPADALHFDLPESLIAQEPPDQRTDARLLVVNRNDGRLEDRRVPDLTEYLRAGDTLVLNDTRVLPAKFVLQRDTGGRVGGLFLKQHADGAWEVLLRGSRKLAVGERLHFRTVQAPATKAAARNADPSTGIAPWIATLEERGDRGRWRLRVRHAHVDTIAGEPVRVLHTVGRMPLPPYIRRDAERDARDPSDRQRYQTVYAARDGAIAAPTAGLHFTETLLAKLTALGIATEHVTLHVGYGTFAPIEVDNLADHVMHAEYCEIGECVAQRLRQVRADGGRVVAVGTTAARTLESAWRANAWRAGFADWTNLFCYPPDRLGGVDVLMTNFHLPGSTLIAMIMAFAGIDLTRTAYAHAIAERYRFYSYGDAMLIV